MWRDEKSKNEAFLIEIGQLTLSEHLYLFTAHAFASPTHFIWYFFLFSNHFCLLFIRSVFLIFLSSYIFFCPSSNRFPLCIPETKVQTYPETGDNGSEGKSRGRAMVESKICLSHSPNLCSSLCKEQYSTSFSLVRLYFILSSFMSRASTHALRKSRYRRFCAHSLVASLHPIWFY